MSLNKESSRRILDGIDSLDFVALIQVKRIETVKTHETKCSQSCLSQSKTSRHSTLIIYSLFNSLWGRSYVLHSTHEQSPHAFFMLLV